MSTAFLRAMAHLEDRAFIYLGTSRECPLCTFYRPLRQTDQSTAPVTVYMEMPTKTWVLVHGETPIACWKDETFGDELPVGQFRRDFALAVAQAHWRD